MWDLNPIILALLIPERVSMSLDEVREVMAVNGSDWLWLRTKRRALSTPTGSS